MNNPSIYCEVCGGRYKKYFKKKHFDTTLHREAENRQCLESNDEQSKQIYEKNKEIERLKEITSKQRILMHIMTNKTN